MLEASHNMVVTTKTAQTSFVGFNIAQNSNGAKRRIFPQRKMPEGLIFRQHKISEWSL